VVARKPDNCIDCLTTDPAPLVQGLFVCVSVWARTKVLAEQLEQASPWLLRCMSA
jgi:hypothetical protein